jgi:hypothetical protein
MRGSTCAGGWAVLVVAAGIAASCGGDVAARRSAEQGSGGSVVAGGGTVSVDAGSRAGSSAGGSGGSGNLAVGGGGIILIDAGSRAGSSAGGGGGEGVEVAERCSDLRNDADTVTLSYVSAEPPTASGGTPVEGRYHLTQWELFTGADGPTSGETRTTEETIAITLVGDASAEMAVMIGEIMGEMMTVYQWNVTLTFEGSSFTSTPTCRTRFVSVSESAGLYTATADQLVFITQSSEGDGTWVRTYTLQ